MTFWIPKFQPPWAFLDAQPKRRIWEFHPKGQLLDMSSLNSSKRTGRKACFKFFCPRCRGSPPYSKYIIPIVPENVGWICPLSFLMIPPNLQGPDYLPTFLPHLTTPLYGPLKGVVPLGWNLSTHEPLAEATCNSQETPWAPIQPADKLGIYIMSAVVEISCSAVVPQSVLSSRQLEFYSCAHMPKVTLFLQIRSSLLLTPKIVQVAILSMKFGSSSRKNPAAVNLWGIMRKWEGHVNWRKGEEWLPNRVDKVTMPKKTTHWFFFHPTKEAKFGKSILDIITMVFREF